MKETDISKLTKKKTSGKSDIEIDKRGAVKNAFSGLWKMIFTILMVFIFAFIAVGISLDIYIFGIATEPTGIDLYDISLNIKRHIYVKDKDTEK